MGNGNKIKCITKTKGYTVVDNVLLLDGRLTPKARFVGIYMLKMRDEWEYNLNGLVKVIGCIGKASLRSGLNELEKFGYLERRLVRGKNGFFEGYEYLLIENPAEYAKEFSSKVEEVDVDESQPSSDYPSSDYRTTDNRNCNNQTLLIINPSNYQNYFINNNNNVSEACQKLKLNIRSTQITKLVGDYGLERVTNGIQFGIISMPKQSTNPEGYIIYAIKNNFSLTSEEQEQLLKAAEEYQKQKEMELSTRIIEHKEAEKAEAERSTTCTWWDQLSSESKELNWRRVVLNVSNFLRRKLPNEYPATLNELNGMVRYTVISELTTQRKEVEK